LTEEGEIQFFLLIARYFPGTLCCSKIKYAHVSSRIRIDIEAVPVVQVSLHGLDNGRYKAYIEYGKTAKGNPVSVCQRSSQISGWIPTNIETPSQGGKIVNVGDIEITAELKTITLRKKLSDSTSVRVFSFLFEKIENKR
jgi:hypothetical protein